MEVRAVGRIFGLGNDEHSASSFARAFRVLRSNVWCASERTSCLLCLGAKRNALDNAKTRTKKRVKSLGNMRSCAAKEQELDGRKGYLFCREKQSV